MRSKLSSVVAVGLSAVLWVAGVGVAAPATLGDAKAAFAAGEYRPCLQKIATALSGPEGKAGSPTRYELLMLRGEAMLRLGERRMAVDAFNAAGTVAKAKQDKARMAEAMAAATLVGASKGNAYMPAGGSAAGIDILEPESRRGAYAALYADLLAANRPKVEEAVGADSLKPILAILPKMRELYAVEYAAKGDATETLALARGVGQRARDLISTELNRIGERLNDLAASAAAPALIEGRAGLSDVLTPRGLTSPEREEVKQIAASLTEAERAAQQGRWISRRSDGPTEAWEAILADCSELKERAQELWDRRF